jgi:hypothetical protein
MMPCMQVQRPIDMYRTRAYIMVACVLIMTTTAYIIMSQLLRNVQSKVQTLMEFGALPGASRTVACYMRSTHTHTHSVQISSTILDHPCLTTTRDSRHLLHNLQPAGQVGILASDVATYSRTLNMIYANIVTPGLRLCSGPSDLPYLKEVCHTAEP